MIREEGIPVVVRSRHFLWMACFASLTAVGGFIRIPAPVVPVTLQSFFVILAGGCLGKKSGAGSQILFLLLGLMGIPVFTMGGGPAYILQPTFGYLAGFPLAAWIVGWMTERSGPSPGRGSQVVAAVLGVIVILVMGVIVLYVNINLVAHSRLTWTQALWSGAILFLPVELIKAVAAMELTRRIRPVLQRMESGR